MFFFFFPNYLFAADPLLEGVQRALAMTRKKHPQMTVGALEALIHIARSQPRIVENHQSLKDIASEMGLPYPTLVRHTDMLGEGIGGKSGLQMLEKVAAEGSRKEKRVELTKAGFDFLTDFLSAARSSIPADEQQS